MGMDVWYNGDINLQEGRYMTPEQRAELEVRGGNRVATIEQARRDETRKRAEQIAHELGFDYPSNKWEFDRAEQTDQVEDMVDSPPHYNDHPSGIECIQITEHMNFCIGNAMKYLWRAGLKGSRKEDLEKAKWYINRELSRETE